MSCPHYPMSPDGERGQCLSCTLDEAATLRAENERLRARCRTAAQTLVSAVGATGPEDVESVAARAVAQLAAANALLGALRAEVESVKGTYKHPDQLEQAVFAAFERIAAHFAGQPAALSSNRCSGCGTPVIEDGAHTCQPAAPARTEAEQAVLDACRLVDWNSYLDEWRAADVWPCVALVKLADAVLTWLAPPPAKP